MGIHLFLFADVYTGDMNLANPTVAVAKDSSRCPCKRFGGKILHVAKSLCFFSFV